MPAFPAAQTVVIGHGAPERPVRGRGRLAWIIVLAVATVAALGALAFYIVQFIGVQQRLDDANTRIDEQNQQIKEQQQSVDDKETFSAAMKDLVVTAKQFDGMLLSSVVPLDEYDTLAHSAWSDRWAPAQMATHIEEARSAKSALDALAAGALAQSSSNQTGTAYEATIDQLGGGYATSVLDDASSYCGREALGCVGSEDPTTVHFDAAGNAEPYMTDWIRTGIAYHEFGHVLQFTNPEPTAEALKAFGGDYETMADCFALTFLPGWALDQRVWISSYEYYDVSVGYGYTCDAGQQQGHARLVLELGVHTGPISQ